MGGFLGSAIGAGIGGLIGLAGGPIGALTGLAIGSGFDAASAQEEANQKNIDLQRETNAQTIDLSNTAHQREMKDLAAAGLNPILSAKYGGSSTPSLGTPSVQSSAPVIQSSAQGIATNTLASRNLEADIGVKKSQVLANSAQAVNAGEEARRRAMENDVLATDIENRKYSEKRRLERPKWQKDLGIDVQDSVGSVLKPVVQLFK